MLDIYRVAFTGHRERYQFRQVEEELERTIYNLVLRKEYVEFYVGRNGDFDIMVASAVKRVQKRFGNHNSSLILVLPYKMKDLEFYEEFYDEVILPISSMTHFKFAITKSNEWLVENSELLIAYVLNESGGAYQCMKKGQQHSRGILFLCRDFNMVSEQTLTNIIFFGCHGMYGKRFDLSQDLISYR